MTPEHEQLLDITELTYDQLRNALDAIPDDKLAWKPAPDALSPSEQILHACGADRGYANHIDGGQRRTHLDPDRNPTDRDDLLAHLDETRRIVRQLIHDQTDLNRSVDIPWRQDTTCRFVLLHMLRHKHYHHGQLTLLRHLLADAPRA